MLLIAVLGETIMPRSEQIAEELRLTALEKRLSVKGSRGLWLKSADHVINISTVMPDFTLLDVTVHRFENNALRMSLRAARARLQADDWLLEDIWITTLSGSEVVTDDMEQNLLEGFCTSEFRHFK